MKEMLDFAWKLFVFIILIAGWRQLLSIALTIINTAVKGLNYWISGLIRNKG